MVAFEPDNLTSVRLRRGLSRTQLHHELVLVGVRRCRSLIDHWETGKSAPRADDLAGLARVLEVPVGAFFSTDTQTAGVAAEASVPGSAPAGSGRRGRQ